MGTLMVRVGEKASALHIPLSAHLDVTWRCNEGCGHCYLDHSLGGDMSTAEIKGLLDQLAAAGTLFLTISGGEIMLRKDIFEIVAHARALLFDIRLKTNGILIGESEAGQFADMGVREVHISVYSHLSEVHDAVTRVPGSLARSLDAARFFHGRGVRVELRCVIMQPNAGDYPGVQALAAEIGVKSKFDPSITPSMDGGMEPVRAFRASFEKIRDVVHDKLLDADADEMCAPPAPPDANDLSGFPCSAGHSACYITPRGDVMPCVQFPMVCGSLRSRRFIDIWRNAPELVKLRGIRNGDVAVCNSCSNFNSCNRCPGLAYLEGDMAGPSALDCEKAYARTGIPSPLTPTQIKSNDPGPSRMDGGNDFARIGAGAPLVQITGYLP